MVEANVVVGEQASAQDNNAGAANEPGAGETITLQQRPEWVPEKFFKDGVVNFKDMAKSYAELEGKQSTPAPVKQGEQAPAGQEHTPAPIQAPMAIPGVAAPEIAKFTDELSKDGKLSPASYEALAKVGYPKVVVDSYIKGLTADADRTEAVSQALIADKQIAEITTDVGGQEVLSEMLAWATANLDAADLAVYNKAVSSSDVSQVRLAVNGLFHAYSQVQDPSLLQGVRSTNLSNVEPFLSNDEVVQAMQNPKYDRDPAYRAEVAARLQLSNVFTQSRDVTHESFARHQS